MRNLYPLFFLLVLTACGGGSPSHSNAANPVDDASPGFVDENEDGRNDNPTQSAACSEPAAATMPASPSAGEPAYPAAFTLPYRPTLTFPACLKAGLLFRYSNPRYWKAVKNIL